MIPKKQDILNKNPNFLEEIEALDESEIKNSETPSLEESVEKAKEVIASLEEPDKALQKFVELKARLNELKSQLETTETEAINEALSILQYNQNHGKNNTVYSDKMVRVSLSFRQRYGTSKDSPELARLEDEIRAEEIRLLHRHREKLARSENR